MPGAGKAVAVSFRCDAGPGILGLGHVARSSTLATELARRGHAVRFVCRRLDGTAERFLGRRGFEVDVLPDDAGPETEIDRLASARVAVVDSYQPGETFYRALKARCRVLALVDHGLPFDLDVDAVLDPHIGAEDHVLQLARSHSLRLLGPRYLLIRDEFRDFADRRHPDVARTVLVTFGGSDSSGMTLRVARACDGLSGCRFVFMVGPAYSETSERHLAQFLDSSGLDYRLLRDPHDVRTVFEGIDMAVGTPSTTAYELAAAGVPLIAITCEDNQKAVAAGLARVNAIVHLGRAEDVTDAAIRSEVRALIHDRKQRQQLSATARGLVDGRGAARVADTVETLLELE